MKIVRIVFALLLAVAALAASANPTGSLGADKGKGDIIGD